MLIVDCDLYIKMAKEKVTWSIYFVVSRDLNKGLVCSSNVEKVIFGIAVLV